MDGVRYAIIDERVAHLDGWGIECLSESGQSNVYKFERDQFPWWLNGDNWNGLGYGKLRRPWSAVCDHGDQIVRWVPPSPLQMASAPVRGGR
jgi:hypothetical protein